MSTSKREVYATKVRTDLAALSTRLSILEAAAKKTPAQSELDYETRLPALQKQRDEIEKHLSVLEEGEGSDWETRQSEIQAAIKDLENELHDAMHEAGLTSEREKEKGQPRPFETG